MQRLERKSKQATGRWRAADRHAFSLVSPGFLFQQEACQSVLAVRLSGTKTLCDFVLWPATGHSLEVVVSFSRMVVIQLSGLYPAPRERSRFCPWREGKRNGRHRHQKTSSRL